MRFSAAVLIVLTAATTVRAASRTYSIAKGGSNVAQFHADDTYDSFDGKTSDVSGTIVADPAAPAAGTVQVIINMDSLETGNGLRDKEMRGRFLQTDKFKNATFKSVSVVAPPSVAPNQPADISVTGDLTLHGVTKQMTIPVRVVLIPDGRIHVTSSFKIHLPDFGVIVPHNLLVIVNDEVPVRLDVMGVAK